MTPNAEGCIFWGWDIGRGELFAWGQRRHVEYVVCFFSYTETFPNCCFLLLTLSRSAETTRMRTLEKDCTSSVSVYLENEISDMVDSFHLDPKRWISFIMVAAFVFLLLFLITLIFWDKKLASARERPKTHRSHSEAYIWNVRFQIWSGTWDFRFGGICGLQRKSCFLCLIRLEFTEGESKLPVYECLQGSLLSSGHFWGRWRKITWTLTRRDARQKMSKCARISSL